MKPKGKRRLFLERNCGYILFFLSFLVTGATWWWVDRYLGFPSFTAILGSNRSTIYATIAQVSASLLGFIITGIPIIINFGDRDRFELLRRSGQYADILDTYHQAIVALAIGAVGAFLALVFDTQEAPCQPLMYIVIWSSTLSLLRVAHCAFFLRVITDLATRKTYGD